jgi:rod shape-determining protein MreB and related proteins
MGNLVVDIGGGTSEVAIISLGGIVVSELSQIAGDYINEVISKYVKQVHNLYIGELTAEKIKLNLSIDKLSPENSGYEIRGRDKVTGLPKIIKISKDEFREVLSEPLRIIANTVKITLEKTPPELISDIIDKGVIMTGGGSLLVGLSELLQEEIGIPTFTSFEPVYCVIKGIGKVMEDFNFYQRVLIRTSKGI